MNLKEFRQIEKEKPMKVSFKAQINIRSLNHTAMRWHKEEKKTKKKNAEYVNAARQVVESRRRLVSLLLGLTFDRQKAALIANTRESSLWDIGRDVTS